MSAPFRIAVVCYPSLGGSGIMATELAVGLARRGHHLHVISSAPPSRPLPECQRLTLHVVDAPDYPLFEGAPPYTLALASAIAEVCTREAIDVLHVHYAVPHAAAAYLARQLLGARAPRTVMSLHGTDVTRVGVDPAYQAITRLCVESAHAITAPSAFLRDAAHAQLGVAAGRAIEVIPNCVDTDYFAPEPARDPHYFDALFGAARSCRPAPTLFHVSNFRAVKRAGDLIDVLARIRTRVPVRLVLVGDGPQRAAIEAQASSLGLGGSVRFLGQLPRFREHLAQADAFLLTSESEGFGLAALEALSCGVPVVGYAVGGLPSVVSDDVGVLVPALDRDALADRSAELLSQPERRARMAAAARQRALEHFRLEPTLERYEQLFERLGPR